MIVCLSSFGLTGTCNTPAQERVVSMDSLSDEIMAIERSALDRWVSGDPQDIWISAPPR